MNAREGVFHKLVCVLTIAEHLRGFLQDIGQHKDEHIQFMRTVRLLQERHHPLLDLFQLYAAHGGDLSDSHLLLVYFKGLEILIEDLFGTLGRKIRAGSEHRRRMLLAVDPGDLCKLPGCRLVDDRAGG